MMSKTTDDESHLLVVRRGYDSDYLFMWIATKVSCVLTTVFLCDFITRPTRRACIFLM